MLRCFNIGSYTIIMIEDYIYTVYDSTFRTKYGGKYFN